MTDKNNLDIAAAALARVGPGVFNEPGLWTREARAALDAIHPALADLTPDDVAAIFALVVWSPEGKWVSRD